MDIKVQWSETMQKGILWGKTFTYHFTLRATFTDMEKALLRKYDLYHSFIYSNREGLEDGFVRTPHTASLGGLFGTDLKNDGKMIADMVNTARNGMVNAGIRGQIMEITVFDLEKGLTYGHEDHRLLRSIFAQIEKNSIDLIEDMKLRDGFFDGSVTVTTLSEDDPI